MTISLVESIFFDPTLWENGSVISRRSSASRADDWKDHSYGGNLIQVGSRAPGIIREDQPGEIAVFYERVTNVVNGSPFATELFAKRISTLGNFSRNIATSTPSNIVEEVPVLSLGNHPYTATRRTFGGYLMEGSSAD